MKAFYHSAKIYDDLYLPRRDSFRREAEEILAIFQKLGQSGGNSLLDVTCGTGIHLAFLREHFAVEGLDKSHEMLQIARAKVPDAILHEQDMVGFQLGRQYDVIICLFGGINFSRTRDNLQKVLDSMASHLKPGGIAVVRPCFNPDSFEDFAHVECADLPDKKIARFDVFRREGDIAHIEFFYCVASVEKGIRHWRERATVGLFSHEDFEKSFNTAGLDLIHDFRHPLREDGRFDAYIGRRPRSK